MKTMMAFVLVVTLALTGCAGMTRTEQRALTGGAMGAAGGALFGAMAGNAGLGAAIGGAVGMTGGYLYGKQQEAEEAAYERGRRARYQQGRRQY